MALHTVRVENPHAHNLVVGQSNFTSTVDNISAALVGTVPDIKFGLAFTTPTVPEAVKSSGTDDSLIHLALEKVRRLGTGKTFVLLLDAAAPVSVIQALKTVPEIREIYCATQSAAEFIVVDGSQGRGVMGLVGGYSRGNEARIQFIRNDVS